MNLNFRRLYLLGFVTCIGGVVVYTTCMESHLEFRETISWITLTVIVLGLVFGGLHHFLVREPNVVLQVAWSSSLFLLPLAPFSLMPFFPDAVTILSVVGLTGIAGIGHGLWSYRRTQQLADKQTPTASESSTVQVEAAPATSYASGDQRPGSGVLWFVCAVLLSMAIAVSYLAVAQQYRGPIAGYVEWHMPVYVYDQRPLFVKTGLAVAATGWGLATACFSLQHFCRSLNHWGLRHAGWGLVVGTTVVGIAIATVLP